MSRSHIFLLMLIGSICGIALASFVVVPVFLLFIIGLIAMTACALVQVKRKRRMIIAALVILACEAGIIRMQYAQQHIPDLTMFSQHHIEVSGVIVDDSRLTEKNQFALFNVKKINQHKIIPPMVISLLLRKYPFYTRGDVLDVQGMFEAQPYNGVTNGILFSSHEEKRGEEDIGVMWRLMEASKHAFNNHIEAALPEPHASFMKGLLLGERSSMPADLLYQFKQTGTSHIIALSGYNITLVGTFLVDALLLLTIPFRATFWIAGSSIILFVLLTGASASLVRAAIMGILILIAAREGRMYHMTNALVCAGVVMLAINPYLLRFNTAFQLSFLATFGLIYMIDPVNRAIAYGQYNISQFFKKKKVLPLKEHQLEHGVKKIISETIAAQLGVLPLLVYLFGGLSMIAPLSNLFVLVAIPYAMAFGFLIGIAGFIWQPLSILIGWGAWALLSYELFVINFFSHIPFAFVSISYGGVIIIAILYGMILYAWWRNKYTARH